MHRYPAHHRSPRRGALGQEGNGAEAHVENLLKRITGNEQSKRDDDGDWPFGLKHAVMYVRVSGDTDPTVNVFGVAAHSVPEGPELFNMLNDVNNIVQFSRAMWRRGEVVIATELVGESLDIEELEMAVKRISAGADHFGPQIVETCGGETVRTPSPEEPPAPGPTGQYL